jgi:predicted ATPase
MVQGNKFQQQVTALAEPCPRRRKPLKNPSSWTESDTHRVRGDLLVDAGDTVAAEKSFHQAIGVARRQSAKLFELRGAVSLARLWRCQGKRTEARDLLAPVYGWFTEGFDTPVLQEAKALLDELA